MKICGKCRRQFNEDEMFCPECGIQLQQFVQAPDAEVQGEGTQVVPQERKFSFEKKKIYGEIITTEVTVQGSQITIYQEKSCMLVFSWGKLNVNLDVHEITDIVQKKGISGAGLIIAIAAFIFAISANWFAKLVFLVSLLGVRDSYLYVYFKNGYVKIPKDNINSSAGDEGSMDDLVAYIKQYNPEAVRVEGNN